VSRSAFGFSGAQALTQKTRKALGQPRQVLLRTLVDSIPAQVSKDDEHGHGRLWERRSVVLKPALLSTIETDISGQCLERDLRQMSEAASDRVFTVVPRIEQVAQCALSEFREHILVFEAL
jgi:hypothetical protein